MQQWTILSQPNNFDDTNGQRPKKKIWNKPRLQRVLCLWHSLALPCLWRFFGSQKNSTWWFQHIWKICSSNWVHLPQIGMKIKLFETWNHHLEFFRNWTDFRSLGPLQFFLLGRRRVAANGYSSSYLRVGISNPSVDPFQSAFFQSHTTRSTRGTTRLMVLEDTRGSTETPHVWVLQASKNFRITQGSPRGNTCTWPRLPNALGFRWSHLISWCLQIVENQQLNFFFGKSSELSCIFPKHHVYAADSFQVMHA